MKMPRLSRSLAALVALASCGNPRAANDANFKTALDSHFAAHCVYVSPSVGLTAYPASIDSGTDTSRFDALVSAGLLSAATSTAEHPGLLGIGTTRTETRTYALTDAGRAAYRTDTSAGGGFCAGHYTVVSVDGFTAPTASNGRTVAQVTFTVDPHLDGWVSTPAVQDRYGAELTAIRRTADHATLVLADKGWTVLGDAPD